MFQTHRINLRYVNIRSKLNETVIVDMKFNFTLILLATLVLSNALAEQIRLEIPSIATSDWKNIKHIGQTKFTRFGIHIYDASLWELSNDNITAQALCIRYARKISAEKLLSSTKKQWQRLRFADSHPLDAWLDSLAAIWPDVKKDDFLIFISSDDGSNHFYSKESKLGSIEDSKFGTVFLDIWLSDKTKYQKQRKELLGDAN